MVNQFHGNFRPKTLGCRKIKSVFSDRLYTSESDVCRRQILTYKDGHRAERNKIIVVDP